MFCKSCAESHYTHLVTSSTPTTRNISRVFAREKAIEGHAHFLYNYLTLANSQHCNNSLSVSRQKTLIWSSCFLPNKFSRVAVITCWGNPLTTARAHADVCKCTHIFIQKFWSAINVQVVTAFCQCIRREKVKTGEEINEIRLFSDRLDSVYFEAFKVSMFACDDWMMIFFIIHEVHQCSRWYWDLCFIFKNWDEVKISFNDSGISLLAVKFLPVSENVEHFLLKPAFLPQNVYIGCWGVKEIHLIPTRPVPRKFPISRKWKYKNNPI